MQATISVWSPTLLGAALQTVPASLLVSILSKPKSGPEFPEMFLTLHFLSPSRP